ncbi:pyridoxal phosphate-dependent decarboxylase family protein [Nocardioides caldifontis]|uniref:pyridoxal phosphate-dependent decarboxylase family protein n=1 Tax=Nocardioides caldifontis TaxID=2588938 RepID=UPI0011DFA846|nr:aspartate aminotransferase family protein [Nocardioides caldifontis]
MADPTEHLLTAATAPSYGRAIRDGVEHVARHLVEAGAPTTGPDVERLAKRVADVDLDAPVDDVRSALDELSSLYLDDAVWFHHPRYVAHLNCPVVIPALLAEVVVSAVNSSLDTWDQSAGGTLVERRLVDWTAARLGLGADADGVFTTGGTASNLQALLLARGETVAATRAPLSRLRVLASADAHFSVEKAADVLGLGREAVVRVPVDRHHRMEPVALERELLRCLADGAVPMAVVATAGTTDFGVIDPLAEIAATCARHRVWLHVDAAFGGGLLASRRRRHLLDGIERADSVTVDFHKTFFQPVSSSAVLVRDGRTLRHVTMHAEYLNPRTAVVPNQVDKSMQTTRRFDALKLWLTLRLMGADAVGELFDAAIDAAHTLYDALADDPDLEMAAAPELSTLVLRYRPAEMPVGVADELNPRIRRALFERGDAVVAGTKVDGHSWLKLTLLNAATTHAQLLEVVELVRATGKELGAQLEEAC